MYSRSLSLFCLNVGPKQETKSSPADKTEMLTTLRTIAKSNEKFNILRIKS